MGVSESEPGHLRASLSWQPTRRTLFGEYALAPLRSTGAGRIEFYVESEILRARCSYPLVRDWKSLTDEDRSLPFEHGANLETLGRMLGVIASSATRLSDVFYESPGLATWHPMTAKLTRTMWDYPGYPPELVAQTDVAALLARPPAEAGGALPLLYEATSIGNPVARFLCVWQALVFHIGLDRPFEVERDFFDRIGVPRDCAGPSGPETRYTQFRNMLSHPKGREVPKYSELDATARELADNLALLVLRDVMANSGS